MNAPKSGHTDFVVLSFERPEGERFAMFRPDDWRPMSRSQWNAHADRRDKWVSAMEQFVQSLELLTEDLLRTRLAEMGLADESIRGHIVRARNIRELNKGGSWEVVTMLGYRNIEGQEVVGRTTRTNTDLGQRVFVMRCTVCGHSYGTYGSEIPRRLCPNCQDGPPGLVA